MPYTVTLGGKPLARGTMQEVQAASAVAVGDMLAEDPEGVAMSAQQANKDFQSGTVEASIASTGIWQCPFWVHGEASTLRVIKEG